jgi:outer membrane beta-barrel protein
MRKLLLIFSSLLLSFSSQARAQDLPRDEKMSDPGLEDIYDKFESQESQRSAKKRDNEAMKVEEKRLVPDVNKISELVRLSPFEDIAVIEKRFLPKTNRLELSSSGVISTNNAFFNNVGLDLRGAFFFNEKFGIEGLYQYLTSSERPITEGLSKNQSVLTTALVEPKSFYGATLKWVPVYGKMAWFQQKIIPFDIYFTPGLGVTTTANGTATTVTMGVGQLFALTKSYGVRWDFNWNFYSAATSDSSGTTSNKAHSDLFLGVGFSYFIPEATYR